jgi:4-hydroxyphenylpyruvate dioxygenase
MVEQENKRPEIGTFSGFHSVLFYSGNAKQSAQFYTSKLGFSPYAYDGLETGNREFATHVVSNGKVIFAFRTAYNNETEEQKKYFKFLEEHGDGVREVLFNIDDVDRAYKVASGRGATASQEPTKYEDKKDKGHITRCSFDSQKDTSIVLIDKTHYKGTYLPNYKENLPEDPINLLLPKPKLGFIDHIVSNHGIGDMEPTVDWYIKFLDFHVFWSVDDKVIHTEFSSLKSVVVADYDETIKMPQNEPAIGKRGKSQIQEYVDYYNGSGVQHIAINNDDVIENIRILKSRGVEFLNIPKSYYDNLRKRLANSPVKVKEDLDTIEKLGILCDFDEKGYLLQLFTKNVQDRPTFFIEFIQRNNNEGFGVGNFKSLFEAIERDQQERGNLV